MRLFKAIAQFSIRYGSRIAAGLERAIRSRWALACAIPIVIVTVGALAAKGPSGIRLVEVEEVPNTLASLRSVKPLEPDLSEYIVDKLAAQQLGKALFWDIQVGSQGIACASCHFHAGADIRTRNQVNPGIKSGDSTFSSRSPATGRTGPDQDLEASDFPFRRLADIGDRESAAAFDSNDVFSSQGSLGGSFISVMRPTPVAGAAHARPSPSRGPSRLKANELCSLVYDPANNPFHVDNRIYRKVEPRQTPTTINAVFNHRQFWDGRANNQFNGVDPFGARTFQAQVNGQAPGNPEAKRVGTLVADSSVAGVGLRLEQRLIDNASLASQATGPPLSDFEMSCAGKTFADLGRKLIALRPLAGQAVHSGDSLFSQTKGLAAPHAQKGLNGTYRALIQKAFAPKFWSSTQLVAIDSSGAAVADAAGFTQMEHNFSLFWGLAIQAYEALLISDDSPFDRAMNGDASAMSPEAKAGQNVFVNQGQCINCHYGPLLSAATLTSADAGKVQVLEHMRVGAGATAFYDRGFYNIGVRPTAEDQGVGATDPYGFDLALARAFKWRQSGQPAKAPDTFDPTTCSWAIQFWPCNIAPTWAEPRLAMRDAVDGAFKVPILRNVGLNPPYFHNGGQASLKDVVRFYNRGGDRRGQLDRDTSRLDTATPFGQINSSNLDPDIGDTSGTTKNNALGMSEAEVNALVQFLLALTDERVACHAAVFDHPELPLPMGQLKAAGHPGGPAYDIVRVLPAVGADGLKGIGKPCFPNSGDLFGSVNKADTTPLQKTFDRILSPAADTHFMALGMSARDAGAALALGAGAGPLASASSATQNATPTGAGNATPNAIQTAAANAAPSVAVNAARTAAPVPTQNAAQNVVAAAGARVATPGVTSAASQSLLVTAPAVPAPSFTTSAAELRSFGLVGFIQKAAVSGTECPDLPAAQRGGSALVNGVSVVIPCNTRLRMPGATLAWAELFPASEGGTGTAATSLALAGGSSRAGSSAFSFPSTEIRIEGNIVRGRFIAGLVAISQQSLNTTRGYVTGIDYANGVLLIGDSPGGPGKARVQLNDPTGRFSRGQSPDARFRVDAENPTVRAATGYPMCVPRTDPAVADDPLCPKRNRPLASSSCRNFRDAGIVLPSLRELAPPPADQKYCSNFVMPDPAKATAAEPIATEQAPFQIGDLVTVAGTLLLGDHKGPGGSDTIAAHTVIAELGIFTQPGAAPSYLAIEEARIGTFSPVQFVGGVFQEQQDRIVLEAVVTDVTSIVDIYLVDFLPASGKQQQRWVTPGSMTGGVGATGSNGVLIDGGITTQFVGPVPGRVRLRANKAVAGLLASPTRYMRVVARSLCDPANINGAAAPLFPRAPARTVVACLDRSTVANGIKAGQYMAPMTEFIFPEPVVPGEIPVPANFWDLGFLANGEGPGTGGLKPPPW